MSLTPNNKRALLQNLAKIQAVIDDASTNQLNSGAYLKACKLTHTMHKRLARINASEDVDVDEDNDACFVLSTSEGRSRLLRLSDMGNDWWIQDIVAAYICGNGTQPRMEFATPEQFVQEIYGDGTNQNFSVPEHANLTMLIEDDEEEFWKFTGVLHENLSGWIYENGSNHMDLIGPKMYQKLVELAGELDEDWFDAIKPMAANDPEVFMQPPIMQMTFGWI